MLLARSALQRLISSGRNTSNPARHAAFANEFSTISDDDYEDGCAANRKFSQPVLINSRGADILTNPLYNKGTAFKIEERDRLRIRGMLPPRRLKMKTQLDRFLEAMRAEPSNIKKYTMLEDLHDRNETLYHRILIDNMEEMAPLIYTPTVGQACTDFGLRYTRPRGMYFSMEDRGHMAAMVHNWPQDEVDVIVVTDGSRILGLGDLGVNGMGISIGKLSLYCAAGGISPQKVLPVVLDCGTNNEDLLNDPYYMGKQVPRVTGEDYYNQVDEFVQAVAHRWPNVMIQFEDFSSDVAQTILDKYRENTLCFNDDIQGTGATSLAGVLGSIRAKGADVNTLGEERILIVGKGSAGIGVAEVLKQGMIEQGTSEEDAKNAFFISGSKGLLGKDSPGMTPGQTAFARDEDTGMSVLDIVKKYKPTIILGLSSTPGLFTEEIVTEMAKSCDRPIIFPLSNPTSKAECTAEQAFNWTDGKCIFASGSPFDPVTMEDGRIFYPTQCNNMFVFPGLGLGATMCGSKMITDRMLYVAAVALANFVTPEEHAQGKVFPNIDTIRDVSAAVAVATIKEAEESGLTTIHLPEHLTVEEWVSSKMYDPMYHPLVENRDLNI